MNDKNKVEICAYDKLLPRYYKGYDMNVVVGKMERREQLSEEEESIILEAQNVYYEAYFRRNREHKKKMQEENEKKGNFQLPPMTLINRPLISSLEDSKPLVNEDS